VIWLAGLLLVVVVGLLVFIADLRSTVRRLETGHPKQPGDAPAASSADAGGEADDSAETARVLTWMRNEIRTPINAVAGMTDLLLDGELSPKQREYVGMLRGSAESLSRTFDDLVDLCRVEGGRVVLDAQPFNVRELVEVSLDQVARMAAERSLDLSYDIAPATPVTVLGDAVRLRQILTTLLTNAFRRTHEGGVTVSVSARPLPNGHALSFVVRDSGIPISTERAHAAFQPLSAIVTLGDRVADAQDLGLALCHGLARVMGGTLTLLPDGAGSAFELVVVAEAPARVLEDSRQRRELPRRSSGTLRVLLAEDSDAVRAFAVDVLQAMGHTVDVAGDGSMILEALERHQYDVVLVDMHMPRTDGVAAIREVCRRWPPDRRPRIVALSASELPEDRALWIAAGADVWVSKSLPVEELRQALDDGAMRSDPASRMAGRQPRTPSGGATGGSTGSIE
jgi:CheY-like chemotaxis protein